MKVTIEDVTVVNEIANTLNAKVIGYNGTVVNTYYWLSNESNSNIINGNCDLTASEVTVENVLNGIANEKGFVIVSEQD